MTQFDPSGTGVALITPFNNSNVDYKALGALIEHVITGGVEYVVSLGTTGEATSLSDAEQENVIRHTIELVAGRVPIVAGHFGGNHTVQLCEKLKSFQSDGISAILSSSPAYVKPSQEGIYKHYMAMAEVSPLPIIIYNVPSRTSSNISAATIVRLALGSKKFIAVKDASADLVQASVIVRDAPTSFCVLSGDDPTALAAMALGGKGVISVIANAFPRTFSDMIRAVRNGKIHIANQLHHQLLDLHHWLYVEGNPVGIKEAVAYKGISSSELRLPLVRMNAANRKRLHEEMDKLGDKA
jgi:4-hydroxy-tetrahydrodipicolinate synthase